MPKQVSTIYAVLNLFFGGILDFIDKRQIVRRVMTLGCFWMMVDCYIWAKGYAEAPGRTGAELAMVLAAILTPVTALQGFLFRVYNDGRMVDSDKASRESGVGKGT